MPLGGVATGVKKASRCSDFQEIVRDGRFGWQKWDGPGGFRARQDRFCVRYDSKRYSSMRKNAFRRILRIPRLRFVAAEREN